MKLRIRGNSIRLRLTQPEVGTLASGGAVEERTRFPDGAVLRYRLVSDGAAGEPGATFQDGVLTVRLPTAAVGRWARETVVGLEHTTPLNGGGELRLLVEKDFECLNPTRGESDEGAYPNPAKHPKCDGPGGV
jgi:hypothetical protein